MVGKLVGSFEHTLDAKNRLTLPVKFREPFERGGYLTPNNGGCLALWTRSGFQRETELREAASETPDALARLRWWASYSFEVEVDRQHRIIVPAPLRTLAGLGTDVRVVGFLDRVEFWSHDAWAKQIAAPQNEWDQWMAPPAAPPGDRPQD